MMVKENFVLKILITLLVAHSRCVLLEATDGECEVCCDTLTHHWSLRMSRHIAPVTELMLGCQIFVINRTCGRFIDTGRKKMIEGNESTSFASYLE